MVKITVVGEEGGDSSPTQNVTEAKQYVALVLDRSGSMVAVREAARSNFNEQVQTIKQKAEENRHLMSTVVSVVTFNHDVTPIMSLIPAEDVSELGVRDYVPLGNTALLDAVGFAITELEKQPDIGADATSVLVVIVTDGQENSSTKWTQADLAEKLQTLQETGRWTFTYMGSNVDLAEISQSYNIPLGNMRSFISSPDGLWVSAACNCAGIETYMSNRAQTLSVGEVTYGTQSFYTDAGVDENKD